MKTQDDLAAEEYSKEILAMNPNGFTVASYVNSDVLDSAFLAGIEFERTRAAELIGDLEHILENASSLDGELSIGHEGAMCLKVALTRYRGQND